MKIFKINKTTLTFFVAILLLSCQTKNINIQENTETELIVLEKEVLEKDILIEEIPKKIQESEIIEQISEEFKRSTSELQDKTITQDDFLTDKKEILEKIDQLAKIMLAKDYGRWLYYLSPQSKEYWQDQTNLNVVSSRLPVKGYTLKNLEDYFRMIFVPSRQNSKVDEIRYVSPTFVKAVQVRGEQDIVYYYFIKINNTWLLELDTL